MKRYVRSRIHRLARKLVRPRPDQMLGLQLELTPTRQLPVYVPHGGALQDKGPALDRNLARLGYQWRTNSCVGFASQHATRILAVEYLGFTAAPEFSSFWPYWWARKEWGMEIKDGGAFVSDGIWVLRRHGAVDLRWMPDDWHPLDAPPEVPLSDRFFVDSHFTIPMDSAADRATAAEMICDCLDARLPVLIGIATKHAARNDHVAATGYFHVPFDIQNHTPDHAICIVDYERRPGSIHFKFANSWGTRWGDNGYGYFPSEYLLHPQLSHNANTFNLSQGLRHHR